MVKPDKKINIIMFNMSSQFDWQRGISNRNYHILQTLLKDERVNQIVAVDYLPWTWQKVIKNYLYGYLPTLSKTKVIYQNLFTKARQYSDKLTIVSSVASYFNSGRLYQDLNKIIDKLKIKDDYIVWSYNPLTTEYFNQLKPRLFVFDAVDNWSIHPSYVKVKNRILDNYQIITGKSDIIFTVARELENVFADNKRVYWVPNGIDFEHYQQEYSLLDKRIADIPHPIIGYIGIILGRIDMKIIKYLAEQNPNKSIVLVGSYKGYLHYWDRRLVQELEKINNIYLLGYLPYDQAPMYIQQFDVAIIPHNPDSYVAATNPMKMYEYLACGKPIVATPAPGIDMFDDIAVASEPAEFNNKMIEALASDNLDKQTARRALAQTHGWQDRVDQMLNLIIN